MIVDTSKYITVKEASQILGTSVGKVHGYIRYGKLEAERVIGKPVVVRESVYKMREQDDMFNIMYIPLKLYVKKHKIHYKTAINRVNSGRVESVKRRGKIYVKKD